MNDDDCPGHGKCHGPVGWCPECGDVDTVCDDPQCMQHSRIEELEADVHEANLEYHHAHRKLREAWKNVCDTKAALRAAQRRPRMMVARERKP